MARLEGKVAFITGAARGQGRSHAVRLAEEGADIIAVDIAVDIDMAQTVKEVEALDRRIVASQADVRDYDGLKAALDDGVARLGRLDTVVANAAIVSFGTAEELTEQAWQDVIDVDLTGVWHTVKAAIPHLRAAGGGSIIIMNSDAGLKGSPNLGPLCGGQARPRRADAVAGQRARTRHGPGQHSAPRRGRHRHDPQPGDVPPPAARPPR